VLNRRSNMKLSRILTAAAAALAVGSAFADPIALQPGPVYVQFNNLEQAGLINTSSFTNGLNLGKLAGQDQILNVASGEFNWGVFNVSSVQFGAVATNNLDISGGDNYFSNGGTSPQIHGIFYGFQLNCANPVGCTKLTGGYIDFYWTEGAQSQGANRITAADMNGDYSASNRTDWNKMGKFTAGTLLARLGYQSGAIDGDATTTVTSTQDPLSVQQVGQADGFASVMDVNGDGKIDAADGAWAAALNSDWFYTDPNGNGTRGEKGETRDFRFTTLYNNLDKWDAGPFVQGLRSNDPARAFALPEPASVTLVGLSLLGLGFASRRRKA